MTARPAVPVRLRVARLRVHPVKGAAGVDVDALEFDHVGPRFDRRWLVAAPDGSFRSQRDLPRLARLAATAGDDGLVLDAPGARPLRVPLDHAAPPFEVRVWDSRVVARSAGRLADAWLSDWLGSEHRLAFMADQDARLADPAFAEGSRVSFADGYPALVVTEASLQELARRCGRVVPAERFRPNIVVAGPPPHDEDHWRAFTAGGLAFSGVKLCPRCKVTTIDQATGEPDPDSEPLRALAGYRKIEDKVYFGLNAVHAGAGLVRVGDPVEVRERAFVPASAPAQGIFGRRARRPADRRPPPRRSPRTPARGPSPNPEPAHVPSSSERE